MSIARRLLGQIDDVADAGFDDVAGAQNFRRRLRFRRRLDDHQHLAMPGRQGSSLLPFPADCVAFFLINAVWKRQPSFSFRAAALAAAAPSFFEAVFPGAFFVLFAVGAMTLSFRFCF